MKIEVGMYVRTKIYGIKKIVNITESTIILDKIDCFGRNGCSVGKENIIGEPSFDFMDLIKVGDYLNGSRVIKIQNVENYPDLVNVKIEKSDFRYGVNETLFKNDIKTILTKEQFSSMEYRLGDDK